MRLMALHKRPKRRRDCSQKSPRRSIRSAKKELKAKETIAEVSMAYVAENIDALSADLLVGDQQSSPALP